MRTALPAAPAETVKGARCEQGLTGAHVPGGGRQGRPEPEERVGAPARVRQGPSFNGNPRRLSVSGAPVTRV